MGSTKSIRHLMLGMSYGLVLEWVYDDFFRAFGWAPKESWTPSAILNLLFLSALLLGATVSVLKARQVMRPLLNAATVVGLVGTMVFLVTTLWMGNYAAPFTVPPIAGALLSYIVGLGILARNTA